MKRTIAFALALLMLPVTLAGCASARATTANARWSEPPVAVNDDASTEPSPSPSPSPSPRPSPSPSAVRMPSPTPKKSTPAATAGGSLVVYGIAFTVASGGTGVVGSGTKGLKRYAVAVQNGLSESPASVASTVDSVLDAGQRGWRQEGWTFQRVSAAPYDFVVELTTAANTDYICGKYGINTGGTVNCRGGQNVVINLDRWENGTNGTTTGATPYDPATYRILAINHEVGHALGHAQHLGCPATGSLAPVMMTQYYGLDGCLPNVWPYDADGKYINGPPA